MTESRSLENLQHLFVLCYGRTGSTVVQRYLNTFSGYSIRGERKGVLNALSKAAAQVRREISLGKKSDIAKGVRSPHYGISEVSFDNFSSALANAFTRECLRPSSDTRVCGFKDVSVAADTLSEIEFRDLMTFIFGSFRTPRVVFLTRNHDEVAKSGWWKDLNPDDVQTIVESTNKRFQSICHENPDRTLIIDYSEFKDEPKGLRRLAEWLGERVDENALTDISTERLTHMKGGAANTTGSRLSRAKRGIELIISAARSE